MEYKYRWKLKDSVIYTVTDDGAIVEKIADINPAFTAEIEAVCEDHNKRVAKKRRQEVDDWKTHP